MPVRALRPLRGLVVLGDIDDVVAQVAEPQIRDQLGAEDVIGANGQAVVGAGGVATVAADAESRPSTAAAPYICGPAQSVGPRNA